MEKQEINTSQEKKKTASTNKLMIVAIILLLSFCGYLIWQNLELQKKIEAEGVVIDDISSERDQVKSDLEEMLSEYKELETNNIELSAELEAEKTKIEELLKKAKGKDWSIYKLKKETETLRKIMKGYVVQIDSLNQLNNSLVERNKVVKTELDNEKTITKDLTEKNEDLNDKVTIASHLKTIGLKSYAVKIKSNNTSKPTDRAKKTGKIRTNFTIQKNEITPSGKKWIYIRILTPDGRVLSEKTDDSNKFDFNGVRGLFSSKQQIDYKNNDMEVTIDWVKVDDFPVGEYIVEVYADGVDIGKAKFTLK